MAKLIMFNFITVNGFFKGPGGDISWHQHGKGEEHEYGIEGAKSQSILLFGRITYEMMAGYWPSPMAVQNDPVMADEMNKSEKIVFSQTLDKATWNNTRIIKDNLVDAVKKLKQGEKNLTILGSGTIISQLADAGLIDEYQIMMNPVALGSGTALFSNIQQPLKLKLTHSRIFKNGIVLLNYEPTRE